MLPGAYGTSAGISVPNSLNIVGTGATLTSLSVPNNIVVSVRGGEYQAALCQALNTALSLRQLKLTTMGVAVNCQFTMNEVDASLAAIYLGDYVVADIDRSRIDGLHMTGTQSTSSFFITVKNSILRATTIDIQPGSPTFIEFAYDTIYSPGASAITCGTDATMPNGVRFTNNIFYAPGANAITNNGTKCGFVNNIAFPQPFMTNTIILDPMLVNAPNGDFHLMAASPAIDAASTIVDEPTDDYEGTARPQGLRRDIGAFEYKP